jgi:hypothetical protein
MEIEIRRQVMDLIHERLQRLSIRERELASDFDLVKSGLLNSIEFVDLVASLEKLNAREIDYEKALDSGEFTTLGGLIRTFAHKE